MHAAPPITFTMKSKTIRSFGLTLSLVLGLFTAPAVFAQNGVDHSKSAATAALTPVDAKTDAAWLAKAIAAYPLDGCVVSGDKFDGGAMGKPKDFIYKTAGQPDRLVRLCCKDCVKDFNKEPAKYLKALDEAVASKAAK
jgi:hypothetical protein